MSYIFSFFLPKETKVVIKENIAVYMVPKKPYKMAMCIAGMTLTEFDDKTANDFYKFLFI